MHACSSPCLIRPNGATNSSSPLYTQHPGFHGIKRDFLQYGLPHPLHGERLFSMKCVKISATHHRLYTVLHGWCHPSIHSSVQHGGSSIVNLTSSTAPVRRAVPPVGHRYISKLSTWLRPWWRKLIFAPKLSGAAVRTQLNWSSIHRPVRSAYQFTIDTAIRVLGCSHVICGIWMAIG